MSRRRVVLAFAAIALVIFAIAIIAHGRVGPAVPLVLVSSADVSRLERSHSPVLALWRLA